MKIFKGNAELKTKYIFESDYDLNDVMFFDIETTGLSREKCCIYLIGALYFESGNPCCIQWLSDSADDEKDILFAFASFAFGYRTIIHFNGNSFDMPFVCERCKKHDINFNFDKFNSVDLYKIISPFKHVLKLENMKQKSLESFIGIDRQDIFSGGDLIHIYREFLQRKDDRLEKVLLLHNYEDVVNMINLVSLESYEQLFVKKLFTVDSCRINDYTSMNGEVCHELIISIHTTSPLPAAISYTTGDFYISGSECNISLRSKIKDNQIKLYQQNYKDYYYLPVEDVAIHKSVSQFVDKNFRQKATAQNCYTKIIITDNLINDMNFLKKYADNILDTILHI